MCHDNRKFDDFMFAMGCFRPASLTQVIVMVAPVVADLLGMTASRTESQRQMMDRFLAAVEAQAFRLAMAQLRDRDTALDAVQDAMIALVRKYAHKPEPEWTPLFFRILQNRIRDLQRGAKRFVDGADHAFESRAAADDPEAQHAQQQAIAALEQALAELPRRQREVVLLRVWEGFNVAETARIMGCGQGSVKTHLSRAMQALRSKVEVIWA